VIAAAAGSAEACCHLYDKSFFKVTLFNTQQEARGLTTGGSAKAFCRLWEKKVCNNAFYDSARGVRTHVTACSTFQKALLPST
jgi:hypothetical protein